MFLLDNPIYIGVAVLIAAAFLGSGDLLRFRMRRVNAIAGVCFAESIRRRVLWITPLAILGVVVVSALQKPMDEQDAIRQTTKYCLFATGLIVTVAAIILACTNLPKEIESRVIFTIVTKPTTRLEIVLGKVIGFASVSAMILLIMGSFTWGYLQLRSAALLSRVRTTLESGELEAGRRSTLEYYRNVGLLSTKSLEVPDDLQIGVAAAQPLGHRAVGGRRAGAVLLRPLLADRGRPPGAVGPDRPRDQPRRHGRRGPQHPTEDPGARPSPEEKTELKHGAFPAEAAPQMPERYAARAEADPTDRGADHQQPGRPGRQGRKRQHQPPRPEKTADQAPPDPNEPPDPPGVERMFVLVALTAAAVAEWPAARMSRTGTSPSRSRR